MMLQKSFFAAQKDRASVYTSFRPYVQKLAPIHEGPSQNFTHKSCLIQLYRMRIVSLVNKEYFDKGYLNVDKIPQQRQ